MLSTKLRTTIATLATAFTVLVAIGPLEPAAQAQIFRPDVMKRHREICENYKIAYDSQVAGAIQIDGNPDGENQSDEDAAASDQQANQTRANAQKAGCGWAA